MLPQAFLAELLERLDGRDADAVAREKQRLAKKHGLAAIPTDIEVLMSLDAALVPEARRHLTTKPVRSASGVCVVAVMTRPSRCPHGRCTYCPGGVGSVFGDVPQSYTGHEPASMRGARAAYDAYVQVFTRLEQYVAGGHDPQKAEVIVMGGTFPHEDAAYREEFITDVFRALNDFGALFYDEDGLRLDSFREFFELPGRVDDEGRVAGVLARIRAQKTVRPEPLEAAQERNERSRVRCVGLTVETRPSHGRLAHGNDLLRYGCTRVELGVQTTYDDALHAVNRDHTVAESAASSQELRDLGFKLNYHVMLGLPLMTRERDLAAAHRIFEDPAFRPDMVKLYPCMVMPGTPLQRQHERGEYEPLSTAQAADLIAEIKGFIPRWCRVMRVQRDIPTKVTEAGVDRTNLRQYVDAACARKGIVCRCIRCREIGAAEPRKAVLNVVAYEASGGEEFFISIDDPTQDKLIGFCRLRFPGKRLRDEFTVRTAVVRELHVYGKAAGLGVVGVEGSSQHKGFGGQLLQVAERICTEHGKERLLIISGVGVRGYYRKLGYERMGPYMGKRF